MKIALLLLSWLVAASASYMMPGVIGNYGTTNAVADMPELDLEERICPPLIGIKYDQQLCIDKERCTIQCKNVQKWHVGVSGGECIELPNAEKHRTSCHCTVESLNAPAKGKSTLYSTAVEDVALELASHIDASVAVEKQRKENEEKWEQIRNDLQSIKAANEEQVVVKDNLNEALDAANAKLAKLQEENTRLSGKSATADAGHKASLGAMITSVSEDHNDLLKKIEQLKKND